ncbi:MAG: hypothetical protein NVSMB14_00790 [Isosphaeraceae bacterium]
MRTVNYWVILHAMAYLTIEEAMNGGPLQLDPDDELNMKGNFDLHIKPYLYMWPQSRLERFKLSMAYFIDQTDILDEVVLANLQDLTMREPADIRKFFCWLWECIFPELKIEEVCISDVKENNDVTER